MSSLFFLCVKIICVQNTETTEKKKDTFLQYLLSSHCQPSQPNSQPAISCLQSTRQKIEWQTSMSSKVQFLLKLLCKRFQDILIAKKKCQVEKTSILCNFFTLKNKFKKEKVIGPSPKRNHFFYTPTIFTGYINSKLKQRNAIESFTNALHKHPTKAYPKWKLLW